MSRYREMTKVAASQRSLVTTNQLRACGFTSSAIGREVAAGRLRPMQPRVYLVGGVEPDWGCRLQAGVLSCGGVASHRSAAFVWDLVPDDVPLELLVATGRSARLRGDVLVHHTSALPRAVTRAGIPVTTPMRTLLDCAAVLNRQEVADAVEVGLLAGLFSVRALSGELERVGRSGRNGSGVLRSILAERLLGEKPAESVLEARALAVFGRAGLPVPVFQFEVRVDGRLVARIDMAFPQFKIAIEIDGWSSRSTSSDLRRSTRRRNALTALGWTVLHFTWLDIVKHPDYIVGLVRGHLLAAGA